MKPEDFEEWREKMANRPDITDPKFMDQVFSDFFGKSGDEIVSSAKNSTLDALQKANDALSEAKEKLSDKEMNPTIAADSSEKKAEETEAPKEPETDPMEDLESLTGLQNIKHDVKELIDFVTVQKMREEKGLKSVPVSLHLVFTGNPGTGKTTVARIIARLYKKIGVLSQGQLVEVDRAGLVAGYVGQTAMKTQEKIAEAKGGVLFIDEAYTLAKDGNDFGQEAIDTILKAMEDNREDFVVIVAGYTEPMEKFINSNPGLKSRFNKYIDFPDYKIEELVEIFDSNCKKYDYILDKEAKDQVKSLIMLRKTERLENFANAREVRNLFEEIITNQARRIARMENPTDEDMRTITVDDLRDEDLEDKPEAKEEKKTKKSTKKEKEDK